MDSEDSFPMVAKCFERQWAGLTPAERKVCENRVITMWAPVDAEYQLWTVEHIHEWPDGRSVRKMLKLISVKNDYADQGNDVGRHSFPRIVGAE